VQIIKGFLGVMLCDSWEALTALTATTPSKASPNSHGGRTSGRNKPFLGGVEKQKPLVKRGVKFIWWDAGI
jgi:hypothetical protein